MRYTFRKVGIFAAITSAFLIVSAQSHAEEDSAIARGAQLYDNWMSVLDAEKPTDTHPSWPSSNDKKKGDTTWRCKSCHGWDLRGTEGAYASGSYKTGIGGIRAYDGGDAAKVIEIAKDENHGLGIIPDADLSDLALFVTKGQIDMTQYINADKSINGNPEKGEAYFNTLCAGCHGKDGKQPKDLPDPLGKIVSGNPWEGLHKIMNGQPNESMPALRALPIEVSVDTLAYTVTLPKE